jgi:hypothetical protein
MDPMDVLLLLSLKDKNKQMMWLLFCVFLGGTGELSFVICLLAIAHTLMQADASTCTSTVIIVLVHGTGGQATAGGCLGKFWVCSL